MKFYGDGTALVEKRERMKETISEAKTKWNFNTPYQKPKTGMSTIGRMTLKQEMKGFNKVPLTYQEARERIYGNKLK